jgi:hypothetical protein
MGCQYTAFGFVELPGLTKINAAALKNVQIQKRGQGIAIPRLEIAVYDWRHA